MTKSQRRILRKKLTDYSFIAEEIAEKERELNRLRGAPLRATHYDPTGVKGGNAYSDVTGGTVVRIESITKQIAQLRAKQNEIDELLCCLGFFERKVIRTKWLERCTWHKTAEILGYSEAYISIIERTALEKLHCKMNAEKK